GHRLNVHTVAWSPDGRRLASADGFGKVKIWEPATGKELLEIQANSSTHTAQELSWSPDGSRLVTSWPEIWDTTTGKKLVSKPGTSLRAVSWSPDGKLLAGANDQGQVKVLDAATAEATITFRGHSDWVRCVAWHPDSKRLASASLDGTVKIWDAEQKAE